MNIEIKVIPNAKKEMLKYENGIYTLKVLAAAIDNKANEAVINFFRKELKIKKGNIKIVRGEKSRQKIIAIDIDDTTLQNYLSSITTNTSSSK